MTHPHDVLLRRLRQAGAVRLVARLAHSPLTLPLGDRYLYVFVPDLHLVSPRVRARYRYGFDWSEQFSRLTTALLETDEELFDAGHETRVVQLGDFVDLWRESHNDPRAIKTVLDAFPDLRDRFLRNSADSLGPMLVLGNHDLEARQSRNFARARLAHYLPGADHRILATHGDGFDILELLVPDQFASFVVRTFGRLSKPEAYPMGELREIRDRHTTPASVTDRIQGDAEIPGTREVDGGLPERFNVIEVERSGDRGEAHDLLARAVQTVELLRSKDDADGRPVAPNLSVVVIGHTHHARMVVDREAGLVLMDCGGWVENYRSGAEVRPNRQIGAICGPDLRIYQID